MSQTALITGASGGLVKAFAEALAVRVAPGTVVAKVIKKWQSGLIEKGGGQCHGLIRQYFKNYGVIPIWGYTFFCI